MSEVKLTDFEKRLLKWYATTTQPFVWSGDEGVPEEFRRVTKRQAPHLKLLIWDVSMTTYAPPLEVGYWVLPPWASRKDKKFFFELIYVTESIDCVSYALTKHFFYSRFPNEYPRHIAELYGINIK